MATSLEINQSKRSLFDPDHNERFYRNLRGGTQAPKQHSTQECSTAPDLQQAPILKDRGPDEDLRHQAQQAGREELQRHRQRTPHSSQEIASSTANLNPANTGEPLHHSTNEAPPVARQVPAIPAWPAAMTVQTVVAYLDMGSAQTLHRHIKANPTFPAKDPRTNRWNRVDIDSWLTGRRPEKSAGTDSWREEWGEWLASK